VSVSPCAECVSDDGWSIISKPLPPHKRKAPVASKRRGVAVAFVRRRLRRCQRQQGGVLAVGQGAYVRRYTGSPALGAATVWSGLPDRRQCPGRQRPSRGVYGAVGSVYLIRAVYSLWPISLARSSILYNRRVLDSSDAKTSFRKTSRSLPMASSWSRKLRSSGEGSRPSAVRYTARTKVSSARSTIRSAGVSTKRFSVLLRLAASHSLSLLLSPGGSLG
jgi:hypothetical protein